MRGRDADIKGEIVGVIRDVKTNGLNAPVPDEVYYPMRQLGRPGHERRRAHDRRRRRGCRRSSAPRSRRSTRTSRSRSSRRWRPTSRTSLGTQRIVASLTTIFAALAFVMSVVGLYSVLAYAVSQRTAEIGIRMALGAQSAQVIRLIMRSGLELVAIGLVLGLAAAAGAARVIQTLLFDVRPLEPAIYAAVAITFALVAALACLLPSLRASRIDPIVALRAD